MAGDREYRIAALSACLALVRPVGMTADETLDWLEVAADTVSHIPVHILERGARLARTRCTHHAHIVPAIIEATREDCAWHGRAKTSPALRLVAPEPAHPGMPLPDPETLMSALRRMGLERGWFVKRGDRLEWAALASGDETRRGDGAA